MKTTISAWQPLFLISLSLFVAGCTAVRTYSEDKERVDQVLTEGNQGYFLGRPKEGEDLSKGRKLTRKTYVTEIELGFSPKKKKPVTARPVVKEVVAEPAGEPILREDVQPQEPSIAAGEPSVSYTVLPNDTLQKISQKVYGTSKKWKMIFEANSDQLKSPDRVYAGQVLKIPRE